MYMMYKNYSRLERWLHYSVLHSNLVRKFSFDLERIFFSSKSQSGSQVESVYICGLARSGTTILLKILDNTDTFRSLMYRDMPFVMAPNLWMLLSGFNKRELTLRERTHADGIFVNQDSPEAFEEIFWQTFDNPSEGKSYDIALPSDQTLKKFSQYKSLLVFTKKAKNKVASTKRYLSKNNNNLLRLQSLHDDDPSSLIFLVYRDPLATARSLHRQHLRFLEMQRDELFISKYMGWLGHHEFGVGHKPFHFAIPYMTNSLNTDSLDYWLDYWNAVYQYLILHHLNQVRLVHHESMCYEPRDFLCNLFEVANLDKKLLEDSAKEIKPIKKVHFDDSGFSIKLVQKAYNTYNQMLNHKKNIYISKIALNDF